MRNDNEITTRPGKTTHTDNEKKKYIKSIYASAFPVNLQSLLYSTQLTVSKVKKGLRLLP
jgi:hypothetical protein